MSDGREAGRYTLKKFNIVSEDGLNIDIRSEFRTWSLTESMDKSFVYGLVTIVDSNNIFKRLTGKEELEIEYDDFYEETRQERYVIYAVNGVKPYTDKDDQIVEFTMHFCSREKFVSDAYRIQKSYSGTIAEMVEDVFDEFYAQPQQEWWSFNELPGKELFLTEETEGANQLVIPNMRPDETMGFLAKRAYSNDNPSSLFRFWETRSGFYFSTFENMIFEINASGENIPIFTYNMMKEATREAQAAIMTNILSIDMGERVDTISDMKAGSYKLRVTELDLINHTPVVFEYNHLEGINDVLTPSAVKFNHDQDFVDKYLSETQNFLVIKDYMSEGVGGGTLGDDLRENQFYPEIFTRKYVNKYHGKRHTVTVEIYGRNSGIYAGGLVQLNLDEFRYLPGQKNKDTEYSGFYVIEAVEHKFEGDSYRAMLKLTKYGIGDEE